MQIILGMYYPQTNTCPLVVTYWYHKCLLNYYSVFRKVATIHSFGALVTILWGISDRLSISYQINKNTDFITKHVVIKLQYRVFPRSAPRVISAQHLILTHNHPDFWAFGRTGGA